MTKVQIRVYGEPQPAPKKDLCLSGKVPRVMNLDYRTKTDPITGQKIKYLHGYKRRWLEHVRRSVLVFMAKHSLSPYPKREPIAIGCLFFLTQVDSNTKIFPAQPPDEDNFDYAIKNALKRTPKKKGQPGPFPNGVLYYDDDQIVWRLQPAGKLWATEENPPGVLITVAKLTDIHEELREYDPYRKCGKQESLV